MQNHTRIDKAKAWLLSLNNKGYEKKSLPKIFLFDLYDPHPLRGQILAINT